MAARVRARDRLGSGLGCVAARAAAGPWHSPLPRTLRPQYTLHTKLGDGMTATVFVAFDKHRLGLGLGLGLEFGFGFGLVFVLPLTLT